MGDRLYSVVDKARLHNTSPLGLLCDEDFPNKTPRHKQMGRGRGWSLLARRVRMPVIREVSPLTPHLTVTEPTGLMGVEELGRPCDIEGSLTDMNVLAEW